MSEKSKPNTGMAIVAYLVFFLPLLTEAKKDPFVRYHVGQGLGLLITFFIFRFLTIFLLGPSVLFAVVFYLYLTYLINILLLVLLVLGIMNAANGKQKPLPV